MCPANCQRRETLSASPYALYCNDDTSRLQKTTSIFSTDNKLFATRQLVTLRVNRIGGLARRWMPVGTRRREKGRCPSPPPSGVCYVTEKVAIPCGVSRP